MPAHDPSGPVATLVVAIAAFTFLYPVAMAWFWMIGAVVFHLRLERATPRDLPDGPGGAGGAAADDTRWPPVSVLLPCHDESAQVVETVAHLLAADYPDLEIIAVDDGSSDDTGARLDALARSDARLRVVHQSGNQGKAVALTTATLVANGEILVGIDGDAVLDRRAIRALVRPFLADPRLGAVTGNPRIRTRSTVLGRLQVAEFSSIVGLIKRAQQVWFGRLFTVSGVIVAMRRDAVAAVGYWSHDMLTEDIDISWKLQTGGWRIRFEPAALVWILMPETLSGLWRQRLRWAIGGVQVARKYAWVLADRRQRGMWPIYAEYAASLLWAYLMAATLCVGLLALVSEWIGAAWPSALAPLPTLLPGWTGITIAMTCLAQFGLALWMDARYDIRLRRVLASVIWYPAVYWTIGMLTALWAVPRCVARARGTRAVWTSPDRGLRDGADTERAR